MTDDRGHRRAVAVGALAETNAFANACLTTGEPTGAVRGLIHAIQSGLRVASTTVLNDEDVSAETLEHLSKVVRSGRQSWGTTTSSEKLLDPGHSMAAAMLRLAGVVAQRARRDLDAVVEVDHAVLEFVSAIPDLCEALAAELDAEEMRSIPTGICAQA